MKRLAFLVVVLALAAGIGHQPGPGVATAAEPGGSYVISIDGNTVTATDTSNGAVAFQGTDAQAIIQSAIDALPDEGGQISIGKGAYTLNRPIQLKTREGVSLAGEGWQTTSLQAAGDNDILVMDGAWFCKVSDLLFDGAGQPVNGGYGRGIYLGQTEPEGNQLNIFTNLFFADCRVAIADDFNGQDTSCDNLFDNIKIFDSRYCDIRLWVSNEGYWNFEYIEVDHIAVDNDPGQPAVVFKGFHGIGLEEFGMLGWANDGLVFEECAFVSIAACDFDHGLGSGIVMKNCEWVKITDTRVASTCMGTPPPEEAAGLRLDGCSHLNFSNLLAGSTEGGGHAIALLACDYGNLTNIISTYNSGSALYLLDSDHINVGYSVFDHNEAWGVEEAGDSHRNLIGSVQAFGDRGGITWCGDSTVVRDSWSNNDWIAGPAGGSEAAGSGSATPAWAWAVIGVAGGIMLIAIIYLLVRVGSLSRSLRTPQA